MVVSEFAPSVHPRRRGEHLYCVQYAAPVHGSSPQARGTHTRRGRDLCRPPVHPRRRGEHRGRNAWLCQHSGSSPQARGTPAISTRKPHKNRFIPAGAGNTPWRNHASALCAVHPRRRFGSSPQARGTRAYESVCVEGERFIPAGAGNTSRPPADRRGFSVHPRRRGEHADRYRRRPVSLGSSPQARGTRRSLRCKKFGAGSSPQARGTRIRRYRAAQIRRFIPAGAGNTLTVPVNARQIPVHPRRRGEHTAIGSQRPCSSGSSPQARGTHMIAAGVVGYFRFIPAGAGNTANNARCHRCIPVHPRRRGEHLGLLVG